MCQHSHGEHGNQVYLKFVCETLFGTAVFVAVLNKDGITDKTSCEPFNKPSSGGTLLSICKSQCPFLQTKRTVDCRKWHVGVLCNLIVPSSCLICFISFGFTNLEEKSDKAKPSCVFTSKVMDDNVSTMSPLHVLTQTSEGGSD